TRLTFEVDCTRGKRRFAAISRGEATLLGVEIEKDNLVARAGSGGKFPEFDGLECLFGKNGVAAEDGHLGHGSVREHRDIELYDAANSGRTEERGILGRSAVDDFAAGGDRGVFREVLRVQEWRNEADSRDHRR